MLFLDSDLCHRLFRSCISGDTGTVDVDEFEVDLLVGVGEGSFLNGGLDEEGAAALRALFGELLSALLGLGHIHCWVHREFLGR